MDSAPDALSVFPDIESTKQETLDLAENGNLSLDAESATPDAGSTCHHTQHPPQQDKSDEQETSAPPDSEDIPSAATHSDPTFELDGAKGHLHEDQENGHAAEDSGNDYESGQFDVTGPTDHWSLADAQSGWEEEASAWTHSHQNGPETQQDISRLFGAEAECDPFSFGQDAEAAREVSVEEPTEQPDIEGKVEPVDDEPQRGNPFDDVEGGGLFPDENEYIHDPESQGYALLPDHEDPLNGTVDDAEDPESNTEPAHRVTAFSTTESTSFVTAFSQIQSHPDSERGLEIQEIIESTAPEQPPDSVDPVGQAGSGSKLWASLDAGEEFDFSKVEQDDPPPPEPREHPFAENFPTGEGYEDDGFNDLGLTLSKDELEAQDLLDDESFAELFPAVERVTTRPEKQTVRPTVVDPAPVSSLFEETPDAGNLFNKSGNFQIAPILEDRVEEDATASGNGGSAMGGLVDVPETDELLDDLDFIDDSEFMAAFGSPSGSQAAPALPQPAQSTVTQVNGSRQAPVSRYAPVQPAAPPAQPQYAPKQPYISPPQPYVPPGQPQLPGDQHRAYIPAPQTFISTPQQTPSQPSQPSSKYAPSAAAGPIGTAPKVQSPQVRPTEPTWSQTHLVPPPPRPASEQRLPKRMSSSFVTAKGAYSSPYDLPMDIAPKPPKRHIPPPIPTQSFGPPPPADTRPPHSADFRSTMSGGPVGPSTHPRAVSAQPHFPGQQHPTFSPPQQHRQPPISSQYARPQVSSPPLTSPGLPSQRQVSQPLYQAQRQFSPPPPQQYPATEWTSGPGATKVLPVNAVQQSSMYAPGPMPSPPAQQPASIYGPIHAGSPPSQPALPASGMYGPGRVMSPLSQQPSVPQSHGEMPGQRGLSSHIPPQTTAPPMAGPPSSRYAPGSRAAPPRSVSAQQVQPPNQTNWQAGPVETSPPRGQPPFPNQQFPVAQSQPTYMPGPPAPQAYPPQPVQGKQSPPAPLSQVQHPQHQGRPPFQPPQEHFYPQSQPSANPHADLPPHFEMESGAYDQSFEDPEGLIPFQPPPQQFTQHIDDRNIMKTPEPIDHQTTQPFDDTSPPRPWERAMHQLDLQPHTRTDTPFERKDSLPVPPPPQERRSVTPQTTRPSVAITSPRREIPEKSATYPARKPSTHVRAVTAPRTQEEDFAHRRAGHPLITFGFGGRMVTMIPRTPHRVTVHGVAPAKVSGPLTFGKLKNVVEPPGLAHQFPGPLFVANKPVKGKGKEIGKWLDDFLIVLEKLRDFAGLEEQDILQIEDRKVLVKLLKLLVDHNGTLDGNPAIEKAVRELLLPQAAAGGFKDGSESFGVTASALATSTPHTTTADPNALVTYNLTIDFLRSMRQFLIQGDRQTAIGKAVDAKMWGHALLVASSVSPIVWKETVEQFIRSELRDTGAKDFESLRFLYGVLGGEGTGAVTELLPPINRMVTGVRTRSGSQAPRFGSWKESLGMVIQNQGTMDHSEAIVGLGASLVSEGRVEAGHVCFLLTKFAAKFSAVDMPDTCFSLVGADHKHGRESHVGLPQVCWSEVFEYAQSKFAPDGLQHLLPYKLWHAWALTDYGFSDIAERYCESIGATLQKVKRGSIFITPTLIAALRELTERLADSPQTSFTDKSSWFGSKTTRGDNFWKAFESKVTKFVAGDDATEEIEANGHHPKPIEVQDQRFGRIASDTNLNKMVSMPNLRAQATTPIYGQFPPDNRRASGAHSRYSTAASDRYGPGGPVAATQDYDVVRPGSMPTSGMATPDIPGAGYSPYMQQTATMASNYAPSPSYAPPSAYARSSSYVPPAPATPAPIEIPEIIPEELEEKKPATPVEKDEGKSDRDKDKKAAEKAGWFGGWFRRAPTEPPPDAATPGKPIKAKLGDESSFYYDKDLKKWVNKKAPETATMAAPRPPPPKRPASKALSTTSTPGPFPSGSSPSFLPPQSMPISPSVRTPSVSSEPPTKDTSLPPSRASPAIKPPAQSADPLEALLAGRPASGARVKKPARSRYVDVMNKK